MLQPIEPGAFNREAIVRGWNANKALLDGPTPALAALDVLVLGRREDGAYGVIWLLHEPTLNYTVPMRLDAAEAVLRELERLGAE